jgi:hypothetical protein
MRLATPVEAADPDGRLRILVEVAQVRRQDAVEAAFVLALTDETLQLILEDLPAAGVVRMADLGDPQVGDVLVRGVLDEEFPIERHATSSVGAMGVAK